MRCLMGILLIASVALCPEKIRASEKSDALKAMNWTRQLLYPYFYLHSTGSWVFFRSTGKADQFYRYSANAWALVE